MTLEIFPAASSFLSDWIRKKTRQSGLYLELFLDHSVSRETGFRNGELYEEFTGRECAAALRLLDPQGREGLQHAVLEPDAGLPGWEVVLEALWEGAKSTLPYSRLDPFRVAPGSLDRRLSPPGSRPKPLHFPGPPPKTFLDGLHHLAARASCRVLQMEYHEGAQERMLLGSDGICLIETLPSCGVEMSVVAEKGPEVQALGCSISNPQKKIVEAGMPALAELTVKRAKRMLSAGTLKSGRLPVVFDAQVAGDFVSLLAETFCADTVQKGMSPWAGRLGEKVANSCVSFTDDATLKNGPASSAWDDEGMVSRATVVVENGVLRSFLYDFYTARVDGTRSTGNAGRSGAGSVSVSPSNFFMKPGKFSAAALIKDTGSGLLLTELMGLHTVDMSTGDFSLAGAGFKIENGRVGAAVNRFTAAGNVYDMLLKIDAAASDLKFYGPFAAPSFRVPYLNIGGGL